MFYIALFIFFYDNQNFKKTGFQKLKSPLLGLKGNGYTYCSFISLFNANCKQIFWVLQRLKTRARYNMFYNWLNHLILLNVVGTINRQN